MRARIAKGREMKKGEKGKRDIKEKGREMKKGEN